MNTDLVVMRPSVPSMSSNQNILDEEAVLMSKQPHFSNKPEIPNYEKGMMNDKVAFEAKKNPSRNSANVLKVPFKSRPLSDIIKTPTLHTSRKRNNFEWVSGGLGEDRIVLRARANDVESLNEEKTSVEVVSEMITTPATQEANYHREENTKKSRSQDINDSKRRVKRLNCNSSRDRKEQNMSPEVASEMIKTPNIQEDNTNREEITKTSSSLERKTSLRCTSSRDCNEKKTSVEVISEMIKTPKIKKDNTNRRENTKMSMSQEQGSSKLRKKRLLSTNSRDCNEDKTSVVVISEMITARTTKEDNNNSDENTKTSNSQDKKSSKVHKKCLRSTNSRDCNEDKTSVVVISEMITTPITQEVSNNMAESTKTSKSKEKRSSKPRKKRRPCTSSWDYSEKKTSVEVVSKMITTPITLEVNNNREGNTKTSKSQEKRFSKVRKKRFRCTSSRDCNEEKASAKVVSMTITTPTT